jgi:hypothetical protein
MSTHLSKRENRSGARWYTAPSGAEYPSVTTILSVIAKPALIAWSAKVEREMVMNVSAQLYDDTAGTPKMSRMAYMNTLQTRLGKEKAHTKELAKAGDLGSQAHSLIEWTLQASMMEQPGPSPKVSDKATWAFMAWEDWKKSVNLKPVHIEQTVWSDRYGYAGTMDLLAYVNGVLTVLDWKTGKAVYPEAHLQNAAYRHAIREMGHGDPAQGLIVRLPKTETDPAFEVVEAKPEGPMFQIFLDTMNVWKWAQVAESEYQAKKPEATPDNELERKLCESIARGNES